MDQAWITQLSLPDEQKGPPTHPSWAQRGRTAKQVDTPAYPRVNKHTVRFTINYVLTNKWRCLRWDDTGV